MILVRDGVLQPALRARIRDTSPAGVTLRDLSHHVLGALKTRRESYRFERSMRISRSPGFSGGLHA